MLHEERGNSKVPRHNVRFADDERSEGTAVTTKAVPIDYDGHE
jgi:hypothetical protein